MKPKIPHLSSIHPHCPAIAFMAAGLAGLVASVYSHPVAQPVPEPTADQLAFFEAKVRPVLALNAYPATAHPLSWAV